MTTNKVPAEVDAYLVKHDMVRAFYLTLGLVVGMSDMKEWPDLKLGEDNEGEYIYFVEETAKVPFVNHFGEDSELTIPVTKQFRPSPDGDISVAKVMNLEDAFFPHVKRLISTKVVGPQNA